MGRRSSSILHFAFASIPKTVSGVGSLQFRTPPATRRQSRQPGADKMSDSKKRKVKPGRKLEPMAKRRRDDEILPESSSTLQHAHCHRRKALPEPASVLSKTSKKRKMAETVLPMKKRHLYSHSQDEVRSHALPNDLIFEIIIRLPARSVGKFRSVCKYWFSIASSPSFIKSHVERSRISLQTVVIADYGSKFHSKTKLYDANLNAGICLRKLPPIEMLNRSSVIASCDGLILFKCIPLRRHCIINHLTDQFRFLPRTPSDFNGFLGFYFHQSASEYRLLATSSDSESSYVITVGKSDWRRIHNRRPALVDYYHFNSVDVRGSLYWLAFKGPLVEGVPYKELPDAVMSFNEETEVYSLLPLPPQKELKDRGGNLMNFNGELGLWFISYGGIIDFWIKKEGWIKSYSVYHPNLDLNPKYFNYSYLQWGDWQVGSAVSIKGEELLIAAFRPYDQQFLVHWNLKTGACLVKDVEDYSPNLLIEFPHIEALTLPGYSFT